MSEQGIDLDGQHMKFHQGSAMWIADEGKARALQQKYPRDIAVTLDQQYTWSANNEGGNGTRMDNVHNYTFGPMTSKAAEEFWKRYEKKKKRKARGGKNGKKENAKDVQR